MLSKKALMLFIIPTISIMIILLLLPVLWSDAIEYDLAKFTEEWYKGLFAIFLFLLTFFVVNIYWEKFKELELITKKNIVHNSIISSFQNSSSILSSNLNQLLAKKNISYKNFNNIVRNIVEAINELLVIIEQSENAAIIKNYYHSVAIDEFHPKLKNILSSCRQGKISYHKSIFREAKYSINNEDEINSVIKILETF